LRTEPAGRRAAETTRRTGRLLVLVVAAALAASCRQDMHDQPSYSALEASSFFADGSSARPLPPGTVARGQLKDDELLETGKIGGEPVNELPFAIDAPLMERGREMYDAFCSHCHGRTGNGDGMVVQRGFTRPPSLFDEKLTNAPVGHIFDVITNGFGAMPDHGSQIAVRDRWAITVYVRALQASVSGTIGDVPEALRDRLTSTPAIPATPTAPEAGQAAPR
jgi:mono/diheme cytochrome c family protein